MSVLRHSLWAAGSGLFVTAARFAVTAILARRLSTEAFGQYAYLQWLVDIGFLVCSLGATGVASRYFAEYRHAPSLMVAIARRWRPFSLGLPLVAGVTATFGAWLSGISFGAHGYALLICWGAAAGIWGMHVAALSGLQRFDLIFLSNVMASAIMVAGAAVVPFNEGNPVPIVAIMAAAAAAASLVGVRCIRAVSRGAVAVLGAEIKRAIYTYSLNIWLTALLWSLVWSRGEIPVIRAMLGDEAVAHYAVALTLYGGAVAGVMLGVSGIAPQITRYWGEGSEKAALALCRRAMDLQLLLAGLGALALIWLAPELMRLAFGERYKGSALLLGVLAMGLPALAVAAHNHLLQIITSARYSRDTTLLGVVLLLVLCWVGVSAVGLSGAAWGRAITLLLLGGLTLYVGAQRWGPSAIGALNAALVFAFSMLSVLFSTLSVFESLWIRGFAWLLLSLLLLVFVKDATRVSVAISLTQLLRSRVKG
jgi:O-antigen/teichoic acid export membrane protein